MAEYFPLIDRAVSGLPDATAEARRAIYERARAALIGQLRKTEPAVPEDDIVREGAALDEAIARVEAKFADHGAGGAAASADAAPPRIAPPSAVPVQGPQSEPAAVATAGAGPAASRPPRPGARPAMPGPAAPSTSEPPPGPRRSGAPALPTGKAPPVAPPAGRERPVIGPAPSVAGEARPTTAPARPLVPNRAARPMPPLRTGPTTAEGVVAGSGPAALGRRAGEPKSPDPDAPALPLAADLAVTRPESEPGAAALDEGSGTVPPVGGERAADAPTLAPRGRDAAIRPAAPRPTAPRRFGWPAVLAAVLVALVMIGVGVAAWTLRDRPDRLAAAHPVAPAPETAETGKIVDRASPAQDGTDGTTSGASVPAPVGQNEGGDAGPAIAVAQRAALLVDAPDEPQKIKTYSGTVVWHLDSVSPGQGLPLSPAIKADIDIPDAKLKVTMVVQKNLEPQLPASHTIELHFLPQAGYTLGNVIQINVPDLRKDDAPSGDALAGVPVMIDTNNFLVGLSRGGVEAQNKRLITERNWFDVSVLFAPKRPAKLTFEKGIDGQRLWDQAFGAWGDAKGASGATP